MASIIPGYEYDIFISYRQKDNEYDGWVTEFVTNLKRELHATFKEDISIYFDANPTDGLLENHIVDQSLSKRLNCLIFIPVISQTYCDTKCFAWRFELCSFNKSAKEDKMGRDIRLAGGNVASRILPIKINDLENADKVLLENELESALRSIEFIYKATGVNRPLKPNDSRSDNTNHTYYRDQINKVANAVKEIINAIKNLNNPNVILPEETVTIKHSQPIIVKKYVWVLIFLAFAVAGYVLISQLSRSSEQFEKTIAVLPFINDSSSDSTRYFINGIEVEILNNLQSIKSFERVISRTSTEQYIGSTMPSISEIAKKLGVNYIVQGSGQKYGKNFRLRVQLIRAGKENQIWAKSYEQEIDDVNDIFNTQSEIAQSIASELKTIVSPEEKQIIEKIPTLSLMAWDFYQRGRDELPEFWIEVDDHAALTRAAKYYRKALEIDPKFADAYAGLAEIYFVNYKLDSVFVLANRALSYDGQLSEAYFVKGNYYARMGDKENAAKEFNKALSLNHNDWMAYYGKALLYDHQDYVRFLDNLYKALQINRNGKETPTIYRIMGGGFLESGFIDSAKACFKRAFELDKDSSFYLSCLSGTERDQGNYKKSAEYCKRALIIRPDYWEVKNRLASNLYNDGQYGDAVKYFEDLKIQNLQTAYALWQIGSKKKADQRFNRLAIYSDSILKTNRKKEQVTYLYFDMACINSLKGDIRNALRYFKIYSQISYCELWRLTEIKNEPLLDNLRKNSEFKIYQKDMENKFQVEHERVRNWLESFLARQQSL